MVHVFGFNKQLGCGCKLITTIKVNGVLLILGYDIRTVRSDIGVFSTKLVEVTGNQAILRNGQLSGLVYNPASTCCTKGLPTGQTGVKTGKALQTIRNAITIKVRRIRQWEITKSNHTIRGGYVERAPWQECARRGASRTIDQRKLGIG